MDFWKIEHPPESLAVIEPATGRQKSYGELRSDVSQMFMPKERSLILLLAKNRYECLLTYLAALQSGNPLLLVDASLNPELLEQLVETYRPAHIYTASAELTLPGYARRQQSGWDVWDRQNRVPAEAHESLALLLNT